MRIAAIVEYDGRDFHGWQAQSDSVRSVQGEVEKAISTVANEPISIICAGRTDRGVHATGQVIHFDTSAKRDARAWILGINTNLPDDVSVRWIGDVPDDFHARFSARKRSYRYLIIQAKTRPAVLRHGVTWDYRDLNHQLMENAAQCLVGEHDFSAFRASECQAHSAVRTIDAIRFERRNQFIEMHITANAFLHHMVRNIVGTLLLVGCGERDANWVADVLASKDRKQAGMTAPSNGLYLTQVMYDDEFAIPVNDCVPALHWHEQSPF